MTAIRERVRLLLCLAAVLMVAGLLAGCATSKTRSRYLEQIAPESITNLMAYRADDTLELRYPLGGRDVFAHAHWALAPGGTNEYRCGLAILSIGREKRAARTAVVSPGNRLLIRDAAQWKELLHTVFAGLAPEPPGHGVLLLVQTMETVVYRDAAGELKVVELQRKPPAVVVDKTYTDADFSREAIKLLAAGVSAMDRSQRQFLFQTGEDPTFVLVDLREQLIVFLSYPADPDTKPVEVPGKFTLRALNELLIKSFLITAVKSPVSLVSRGFWHAANSGLTILNTVPSVPDMPPPPLYTGPGMDLTAWEKELDGLVLARRYKGRVQYFIDGDQFFPALIDSIEQATESIDVLVYIFDHDPYAVRMADVLKERSAAVRVRVLMDDIGSLFTRGSLHAIVPPSFQPPGDIAAYLAANSDVRVRVTTDPWLATDHRKCIIIDRHQAYLGGMNIGGVYRYEWHDLMIGLTGPIVGRLDKDYRKAWAFAGPAGDFGYALAMLFDRTNPRRNAITNGIDIRRLRTATGKTQIYRTQLAAIRRARSYIYIESAYFNDDSILRELIRARQRGVDVRVILPAENDVDVMQTSNQVMANEMLRHGIRVYIYPGMTHVKAAIYDGWACVGSANLEKMSLRVSQELDIAFSDPATVDQLKQELFAVDFQRARELTSPITLNWLDSLVKAFANQL
jgi:cardiolipin synthase